VLESIYFCCSQVLLLFLRGSLHFWYIHKKNVCGVYFGFQISIALES
jgi:hypothetical protein